jgi:hypothetical protein
MRWIDLSRSAFYSLPLCFSPLTFASFESSLLPTSSSLGSYVGGRSLAFILIGRSLKVHHRQCEQESIVGGVEKEPLVGGVDRINMMKEDPIA